MASILIALGSSPDSPVLLGSDRTTGEARAVLDGLLGRGERALAVDHIGLVAALTADHDRVVGVF